MGPVPSLISVMRWLVPERVRANAAMVQACVVVALLASGCQADGDDDDGWYFEPSVAPVRDADDASQHVLELVDSLGAGLLEDGRGRVAVSRSGRVAVGEFSECRISVFDLTTRALLFRVGRCGEGPEEFGVVSDLAFIGDSLHVLDDGRRDLVVVSPNGEIARRSVPLVVERQVRSFIHSLAAVGDSMLASTHQRSGRDVGIGMLLHARDGEPIGEFGHAAPAASEAERLIEFPPDICASEGMVVVENPYRSGTVGYRADGSVAWRVAPRPSAIGIIEHDGDRWPTALVRPPVCSQAAVMLRRPEVLPYAPRGATFGTGEIEVRDRDGQLLLAGRVDSTRGEVLFARAAGWRDFFVFTDTFGEVPQLRIYRLRPRRAGDTEGVVQP
jgi:hypothetical protein